jgi:hypothetical protein
MKNQNQVPPPAGQANGAGSDKSVKLDQSVARLQDKITKAITRFEKENNRACFAVGKALLSNPELWIEVKPKLEHKLPPSGPTRMAIDSFAVNAAQIEKLKGYLPKT